jgi:hypothetical protein
MGEVVSFRRESLKDRLRKALDLALAHRSVCYRAMATATRAWKDADDKVDALNRQLRGAPDLPEPPSAA